MRERKDLLESLDKFGGFDRFRESLNKVQSLGDFIFDVCPELLRYAERLASGEKEASEAQNVDVGIVNADSRIVFDDPERSRLLNLARDRKRNRVELFNSQEGRKIRLTLQPQLQKFKSKKKHCALCGPDKERHRSQFICTTCCVQFCIRLPKDERNG